MPVEQHNEIISAAFLARGYNKDEAAAMAKCAMMASYHGIRTHNGIKALHLDDMLGSKVGAWTPNAEIKKLPTKYKACEKWDGNKKIGPAVAFAAMERAMQLADEYGVGVVSVDNATHYLWGGGYVIDAANKGYIAYTGCTSARSEVVPFGGKYPTIGTNPHSWAFPTNKEIGFPICVDWATSIVAFGRIEQFKREGKELPQGWAMDKEGNPTTDPHKVASLLPFGGHKGYGLSLIDELWAAYIGGSLPSIRGRSAEGKGDPKDKYGAAFVFQCIKPDAMDCGGFAMGRNQSENIKEILKDIRSFGNDACKYPGEPEHDNAELSRKYGGLLFTPVEVGEFETMAKAVGVNFDKSTLKEVEV
jgi:LDH2 family malate/lactate/ureidoglycolate dehydrogenase